MIIALVVVYHREIAKIQTKKLLIAGLVGILLAVPIIMSLFTGKSGRIEVMSLFSYERPEKYIQETILNHEDFGKDSIVYGLFHSEGLNFARGIAGRYFNYFSGKFLFFEGDWSSLRHSSPNVGYLLLAEIPILLVGFFEMFKKNNKNASFILLWLMLAPISAAITRDSVHGVRALSLVIPFAIVLGFGLEKVLSIKPISYILISCLYIYNFGVYLDSYYTQNKFANAENYFYGYRETVRRLGEIGENKKIIFSQGYDQPYIFFLFYRKVDPLVFQKNLSYVEGINGDVGFVENLDEIEFRPIKWASDKMLTNTLLVGKTPVFPPEEVNNPNEYKVDSIKYPSGHDAFLIVEPI